MITMRQLAEKIGLSQPTVSLALKPGPKSRFISEQTRQKVLAAARELGYQPNQIARAMVNGHTKVIGVIGSVLGAEHTARMIDGFIDCAQNQGYLVKLMKGGREREMDALHMAIQQRVASVVVVYAEESFLFRAHEELTRHGIPFAILDHTIMNLGKRQAPGIRVLSDDEQGMSEAVEHLAKLGHSRIALVGGTESGYGIVRFEGYRKAMHRQGFPTRIVALQKSKLSQGDCQTIQTELLQGENRPSAILCATDFSAMVVIRLARETGLRIPEDLSVMGFAGLEMAEFADPPLTTVAQPFEAMGSMAATKLLDAIERGSKVKAKGKPFLLPTKLIVRKSTGPIG